MGRAYCLLPGSRLPLCSATCGCATCPYHSCSLPLIFLCAGPELCCLGWSPAGNMRGSQPHTLMAVPRCHQFWSSRIVLLHGSSPVSLHRALSGQRSSPCSPMVIWPSFWHMLRVKSAPDYPELHIPPMVSRLFFMGAWAPGDGLAPVHEDNSYGLKDRS